MRYRTLGKTGLEVSELGYGGWGIGKQMWVGADDDESVRALRRAVELGVNFVDTAYSYGDGHSERLIGRALAQTAETVHVATKVPPRNRQWPGRGHVEDSYPASWVVECTEESLKRLGRETIELQQFHVWSDDWLGRGDWLDAIERLKRDGKIRFFGVSINDHEPSNAVALVESGAVDVVQVIYNVFDQSPEDELFPAVERANVGVIVRVPLDEGGLTGGVRPDTSFPDGDWRNRYFAGDRRREVWERAQAIAADAGIETEQLPELALRFCLSHPAVSTVIAGMRSVAHVDANVGAATSGALPADVLARLRPHRWLRDFYPR